MKQKNNINAVRRILGLSQADFAAAIEVSQGNVSHYEGQRQSVPPDVANRVIAAAAARGVTITFNDIYGS
ncbi:helix-turn-helix domain-containing protein [Symbiopectobacterium purcellii]|uniref:helix-turn-helix domain-containing protein n=1 Tax=Symbiopectobacterium purcellii TaxID=2871826 RepID=UPI003F863E1C